MTSVHADAGKVLIDQEVLRARVEELGAEISADYEGRDLLLVGVLKGAIFFISNLMRELTVPCGSTSWRSRATAREPTPRESFGSSGSRDQHLRPRRARRRGHHRLRADPVLLRRTLGARKPASLEICALLTKPERREVEVPVRYVGFEIPNRFVIGYGLDFAERYRNLPYIGVLHPDLVPNGI